MKKPIKIATLVKTIGREHELKQIELCLSVNRNILLEGPVGVGKTHLALRAIVASGKAVFRVDGDGRYTEQKLVGWFDPPLAMKQGFNKKSFFAGPLVHAMESGGVLFINELNRLPEGVQNVLLPAIDEGLLVVPKLGEIRAKPGFLVVATQNPKEFVATTHLSEAILDRFEWIRMDYQTLEQELLIVQDQGDADLAWSTFAVHIVRATRDHSGIRRGASVRAAIALAQIGQKISSKPNREAMLEAMLLTLPTRIEVEQDADAEAHNQEAFVELFNELLDNAEKERPELKKKP